MCLCRLTFIRKKPQGQLYLHKRLFFHRWRCDYSNRIVSISKKKSKKWAPAAAPSPQPSGQPRGTPQVTYSLSEECQEELKPFLHEGLCSPTPFPGPLDRPIPTQALRRALPALRVLGHLCLLLRPPRDMGCPEGRLRGSAGSGPSHSPSHSRVCWRPCPGRRPVPRCL